MANDKIPNKRYPVVTLVLYFGSKHWDTATTLHECFDIPAGLQPYVSDYKINIFEIAYLTDEQVTMFKSDFKIVADYFVQMRKNNDYVPSTEVITHIDAILKTMSILTGDERFSYAQTLQNKGELKTMCKTFDEYENRGIVRGEQRFAALVTKLLADGRTEDLQKATIDEAFRNNLYEEYGITY